MEVSVGLETIATLLTIVAGVVGLGATVIASNGRTRTELKDEIAELRTELKGDITKLRTELKSDIAAVRTELKADIAAARTELKGDIAEVRTDVRGDISRLDDRVYALAAGLAPRLVPDRDNDSV